MPVFPIIKNLPPMASEIRFSAVIGGCFIKNILIVQQDLIPFKNYIT